MYEGERAGNDDNNFQKGVVKHFEQFAKTFVLVTYTSILHWAMLNILV